MEQHQLHSHRHELNPIPAQAGIGLRAEHYQQIIATQPKIAWFEVHSENYFGQGGKPHYYLDQIRCNYPLSLHGVGLSLGSADDINISHLAKLKNLIERYEPALISEHLCWSSIGGHFLNDLLPLPYTEEALNLFVNRIDQVQAYLKRQILIENISSYLQFNHSTMPEYSFMSELAQRTGCGILLDVNNLYVNSINHNWDAYVYLKNIPVTLVHEIHLAGFTENHADGKTILIDTHNQLIAADVWDLYEIAVQRFGRIPTLIEWDKDLPSLAVLMGEADKANNYLENKQDVAA